jgi:hypothetical protein
VVASSITVTDNIWHHIAVVRSSNTVTIYIDGVNAGSGTIGNIAEYANILSIGKQIGGDYYQGGWIDEVRISKGTARWVANFTPPTYAYISTYELTPNITTVDTFQTVRWDLSSILDFNKDAIDKIIVTVVNADAANTFYLDYFEIAQTIDCFGIVG